MSTGMVSKNMTWRESVGDYFSMLVSVRCLGFKVCLGDLMNPLKDRSLEDWTLYYQEWNVYSVQWLAVLLVFDFIASVIRTFESDFHAFGKFILFCIFDLSAGAACGWFAWYRIFVRRATGCRRRESLIWAFLHGLVLILRLFAPRVWMIFNLFLAVPSFYMCWACVKVYQYISDTGPGGRNQAAMLEMDDNEA